MLKTYISSSQYFNDESSLPKPFHHGKFRLNECWQWMSDDEKNQFDVGMADPVHREYFQQLGWDRPDAITYRFNNEGFRCDDFDDSPCVVVLGCSFTFGLALPEHMIWPTLLGKHLGLKVANLAWPGQGADYCFRLAEYWLPRLNAQLCVMLNPPTARVEVMGADELAHTILPSGANAAYNQNDWFLNNWFMNEENHRLNGVKNKLALTQLCNNLNIPFMWYYMWDHMVEHKLVCGPARDLQHPGPMVHEKFVRTILNDQT